METPTDKMESLVDCEEVEDRDTDSVSGDDSNKPTDNPPTFDMTAEVEQMMKKVMRDILLSGNSDNADFGKIAFTSVDAEPTKSVWVYPGTLLPFMLCLGFFLLSSLRQ
jgi:hypothetical protein